VLGACAPDWSNADLQLDVIGPAFDDEDRVSICVTGAGLLESAAGTGRLAFPGVPDAFPVRVTVALAEGLGGTAEFEGPGYQATVAEELVIEACPGERAEQGTGLLLAVRLLP
jgi:hypothetical protein